MSSASTLPTELIQSILLQTDPETYLSAHQACRSWRRASSTPYMLRHALQQIPASLIPPLPYSFSTHQTETEMNAKANANPKTDTLTPEQWTTYFAQIARLNLLSRRHHIRKSVCKVRGPCHGAQMPLCPSPASSVQARSEDGRTVAVLRGAKVLVFRARRAHQPLSSESETETESESHIPETESRMGYRSDFKAESEHDSEDESQDEGEGEMTESSEFTLSQEFPLASSLYPHWTSVCRALMNQSITSNASWSGNRRYSKHCVAVSSRGEFVAVALGRVVQVYSSFPHSSRGQGHQKDLDRDPLENTHQRPAEYVLGQNTEHIACARPSDPTAYEDTDGVVEGLEFVDNDTLLREQLM
ncbi:F-box protein [Aspergillus melleus]|uniref:F-box protein n=1 Tax=Aspergillus melleus TaxID=138277 RepID=UPI001E8EDFB4|nr:uncharacterized protein LDX57_003734 [Aspergillus melleus]KAH8425996.1 hypothetical protein LDX57_003734 [Aspergillus melleus]